MRYRAIPAWDRATVERVIAAGETAGIADALLAAAHNDGDREWVQGLVTRHVSHSDPEVRRIAVLCLGHLARIHGRVDRRSALSVIAQASSDPDAGVRASASDARDDIETFGKK